MNLLFLELLNRSIAAGWLILIILLLRILKLRFPRWVFCLLWGIVGLRLALPFLFESTFCLIPSIQTIMPSFEQGRMAMNSGVELIDESMNTYLDSHFATTSVAPMVWFVNAMRVCNWIWLIGMVLLAGYGFVSEMRLRRKLQISICCGENVYICDEIASPFVLGILRPRIYLPSAMEGEQKRNALLHERAHIARLDPLWKMMGYILLCVFWFNPLVWVAYILFGRDLEFACDERVLRSMSGDDMREYAQALLTCSIHRRTPAISPVAFGDVGVKRRIQSIVWFRSSGESTIVLAVLICFVLALGFLTSPKNIEYTDFSYTYGSTVLLAPCSCEDRQYETGQFFHAEDGNIFTSCDICEYPQFHVHETGVMQEIGYCSECGKVMHVMDLYEGYQCLSMDGAFVKTEN